MVTMRQSSPRTAEDTKASGGHVLQEDRGMRAQADPSQLMSCGFPSAPLHVLPGSSTVDEASARLTQLG